MPGQWGQRPHESDQAFKDRKETEANNERIQVQTNIALANGIGVLLYHLIKWLLQLVCWVFGLIFRAFKSINMLIDRMLSTFIALKYQRNIVIVLMYIAMVTSSFYAVYRTNVLGFYSLNTLVAALKKDPSFTLTVKKTAYKYHTDTFDHPESIKLIGISGPGTNKVIDVSKERAANGMLNSENKKPVDLLPELAELLKKERAAAVASMPVKGAQKQKRLAKKSSGSNSAENGNTVAHEQEGSVQESDGEIAASTSEDE